jgi:hypothetical protein
MTWVENFDVLPRQFDCGSVTPKSLSSGEFFQVATEDFVEKVEQFEGEASDST